MMRKLFITGTDTGIGKTYFSALLIKHLLHAGQSVYYIKPVQTGYPEDDDRQTVIDISGIKQENAVTLVTAKIPAAPYVAIEDFPYDDVVKKINAVNGFDWLIVESAGGLYVPLDDGLYNFDMAKDCGLESVVVVPNRLGCVNHALLSKYLLDKEELPFAGFAVNNFFMSSKTDAFNISMLNNLTDESVRFVFNNGMDVINI